MKTITVAAGLIGGTMIFLCQPIKIAEAEIQPSTYIEEIVEAVDNISPEAPAEIERIYYDIPISYEEQAIIQDICLFYGIDVKLVYAIASKESNFDETAIGDNGRSLGMYQIQPRYWDKLFNKEGGLDLMNKLDATVACCEILTYMFQNYHDTMRVLNAYNTGDPDNYNGYSTSVMNIAKEIKICETMTR